MDKVSLVPPLSAESNPNMYCCYARESPNEERCLGCNRTCEHAGTHTVKDKQ